MKVGLALGGGGARGLAHIPVLETLDEFGVRPCAIAGTSIGAVFGAIYASGAPASEIRQGVLELLAGEGDVLREIIARRDSISWLKLLDIDFLGKGLIKGDAFVDFLCRRIGKETFEELAIPLKVVAADFWTSSQVVFRSGDLHRAIKASMGLPGIFSPVRSGGRTLIDGGCVNPVPHDVLEGCDLIIAVNVMGRLEEPEDGKTPGAVRAVLETFNIMQRSIIVEKMIRRPPDILVEPDLRNVDLLDFHRYREVLEQAEPARMKLRRDLMKLRTGESGGGA